ncbi:MAG: type 4a pilus biogenesis protein PilO [Pontibacterium sp.]
MSASGLTQLNQRSQLLLIGGGALMLITCLISFLLIPEAKRLSEARETRILLESSPVGDRQLKAQNARLQQQIEQLQKSLHGDMARQPGNQLQAYIIESLQQISWQNQVQLLQITPGEGKSINEFKEQIFELSLTGTYNNFAAWLKSLNETLGFVVITHFSIRPVNINNPSNLSVTLTMTAYRSTK